MRKNHLFLPCDLIEEEMLSYNNISKSKDNTLFTPGPVTTSLRTKQLMLHDIGSRDYEFLNLVQVIKSKLINIAECTKDDYDVIFMQGSGTFGLESVITSAIPPDGKLLVIINGAYGKRILEIAEMAKIQTVQLEYRENRRPDLNEIDSTLKKDKDITSVAFVHCETTTGILNELDQISKVVKKYEKKIIVDALTTFGAMKIDFYGNDIDYLIAGPDKCLEGMPGFAIIFAKVEELKKTKDWGRSLSLNLYQQWQEMNDTNQFRFTPPIQAILSFNNALDELIKEGGVLARGERYRSNYNTLISGMRKLGFTEYLFPNLRSYIITSYLNPDDPKFKFRKFYDRLRELGNIIYFGKLSTWEGFRIATIGRIFPTDVQYLVATIEKTLSEMEIDLNAKINS